MSPSPPPPASPMAESWLSRHAPYLLLLAYLYYGARLALGVFDARWDFHSWLVLVPNAILVLFAFAGLRVLLRVGAHVVLRRSVAGILRDLFGEPTWWRAWYPPMLRDPASVWDELPTALKWTRTAIWLGLLLFPAGSVLAVFVIPTLNVMYASLGLSVPVLIRAYVVCVTVAGYALPVALLAALVQGRRWVVDLGVPRLVAIRAFFSVERDFWRETEGGRLLRD